MSELRRRLPPLASLVAFEAAARCGSFSRAAGELHLSQAAVSRQIRLLEDNLATRLFTRQRYDVALTVPGETLFALVQPLLRDLASAAEELRAAQRAGHELTLFADTVLAGALLIPRLGDFGRQHPQVALNIVSSNQPIEDYPYPIDVGVQTGSWAREQFTVLPICDDEIFPVAGAALARALGPTPAAAELAAAPLLHLDQSGRSWTGWAQFWGRFAVPFAGRKPADMSFNNYPNLLDAAEQGYGIGLGWRHSVEDRLRKGTLVRLGGDDFVLPLRQRDGLCAYVPKNRPQRPLVTAFIDWLRAITAD